MLSLTGFLNLNFEYHSSSYIKSSEYISFVFYLKVLPVIRYLPKLINHKAAQSINIFAFKLYS